jgi:hypothetical protein
MTGSIGATGATGMTGSIGATGATGMTGATGATGVSPFTFVSGSTTDINYTNGNVSINGNLVINATQEMISPTYASYNPVSGSVPAYTIVKYGDNGCIYELSNNFTSNYAVCIQNFPSTTDTTKTFVVCLINNNVSSANYVCNAVYISTGVPTTQDPTGFTGLPLYLNGTNSFTSTTAQCSVQQIAFINQGTPYALSSINQYYTAY